MTIKTNSAFSEPRVKSPVFFSFPKMYAAAEVRTAAILLVVVSVGVTQVGSSVFVADLGMTRMVELNAGAPFCELYHDRGIIQRMVLNTDPKKVRQISNNLVVDLEETCKVSQSKGKVSLVVFSSRRDTSFENF